MGVLRLSADKSSQELNNLFYVLFVKKTEEDTSFEEFCEKHESSDTSDCMA